jgi:hypothetical protein
VLAVDFYLDNEREKQRMEILRLVQHDDPASSELLLGYAREAMRLNPQACFFMFPFLNEDGLTGSFCSVLGYTVMSIKMLASHRVRESLPLTSKKATVCGRALKMHN